MKYNAPPRTARSPAAIADAAVEASIRQTSLAGVLEKVLAGERLDRADGLRLYEADDLLALGYLANLVRERLHGDRAYFVRNVHLNPTNVCKHACAFCAFAVRAADPRAYTLDPAAVRARLAPLRGQVHEVHMVGGIHPGWGYEDYLDLVRAAREADPEIGIKAYTAVEVDAMAELSGRTIAEVLDDLRDAGLTALPGGGAEIFASHVRRRISASKANGDTWLEVHATAHAMGIRTNATMLYGHVEGSEHKVDHLLALRALQDQAPADGGFLGFVPLAFHPRGTALAHLPGPTERGSLREVSVARLLLDNVHHVTAYWVMIGSPLAQVALSFGADDLSGTIIEERITYAAGGDTERGLDADACTRLIVEAGRIPVERDTLYRPLVAATAAPAIAPRVLRPAAEAAA